jgi:vacuolar-type H+-ATPase subunit E/Vma4
MQGPRQTRENHPPVNDLERLVETEARLDELLQAAHAEAGDLIAQARDRVTRGEERWAADFEAARRDLESRVAQERDRELTRIRDEANRLTARYAALAPEQVEALARWVASELQGSTAQGTAP